jgi:hypothetical protein
MVKSDEGRNQRGRNETITIKEFLILCKKNNITKATRQSINHGLLNQQPLR